MRRWERGEKAVKMRCVGCRMDTLDGVELSRPWVKTDYFKYL